MNLDGVHASGVLRSKMAEELVEICTKGKE